MGCDSNWNVSCIFIIFSLYEFCQCYHFTTYLLFNVRGRNILAGILYQSQRKILIPRNLMRFLKCWTNTGGDVYYQISRLLCILDINFEVALSSIFQC